MSDREPVYCTLIAMNIQEGQVLTTCPYNISHENNSQYGFVTTSSYAISPALHMHMPIIPISIIMIFFM